MTNFEILKAITIAATILVAAGNHAQAGDCQDVRFSFRNDTHDAIRVKGVIIHGNNGLWREDINNHWVGADEKYVTDPRNMNRLDSGADPELMIVEYDRWVVGAESIWIQESQEFRVLRKCVDNMTYFLVLNRSGPINNLPSGTSPLKRVTPRPSP